MGQPAHTSSTTRQSTPSQTQKHPAQTTTVLNTNENVVVVPASQSGSRKDAAWMRLSNRVRLLERNVSVSMGYLEELSQSYRRQMERLVRSFNLTTAWLKVTAQTAEARDHQQQARLDALEHRLENLLTEVKTALKLPNSTSMASDSYHRTTTLGPSPVQPGEASTTPASFDLSLPPPVPWFRPQGSSSSSPSQSSSGASSSNHTVGWWVESPEDWLTDQYDEGEEGIVEVEPIHESGDFDDMDSLSRYQEDLSSHGVPLKPCTHAGHQLHHHHSSVLCVHHKRPPPGCSDNGHEVHGCTYRSSWWWSWTRWFTTSQDSQRWNFSVGSMVGMALLHVTFALLSHLLVYYTWLKPVVVRQVLSACTLMRNPDGQLSSLAPDATVSLLDSQETRLSSGSRASATASSLNMNGKAQAAFHCHEVNNPPPSKTVFTPNCPSESLLKALSVCQSVYVSNSSSVGGDRNRPAMTSTPEDSFTELTSPLVYDLPSRISLPETLSNEVVSFDELTDDKDNRGYSEDLSPNSKKLSRKSGSQPDQLKTRMTSSRTAPTPSVCETKLVNGSPSLTRSGKQLTDQQQQRRPFEQTCVSHENCHSASDYSPLTSNSMVEDIYSDVRREEAVTINVNHADHRRRKKWRWKQLRPLV